MAEVHELTGKGAGNADSSDHAYHEQLSVAERDYAALLRLGKKPVLKVMRA